jgi:hypothetical protein
MKHLLATAVLGAIVLAGCTVPGLGTVNSPPIPQAATESPLITTTCRSELGAIPGGSDLLNGADIHLGYWHAEGDPPAEVANTLNAFHWSAVQLGAPGC